MPYQQLQKNWKIFSDLINELPNTDDDHMNRVIKSYVEQNLTTLNDIFALSIDQLRHLQNKRSVNHVICAQAKLTYDMSQKLSQVAQRFLHTSLDNITDYNEWLKNRTDLATD